MKKFMHGVFPLLLALLLGPLCFAQDQLSDGEQKELGAALSEAGNSPVEFARILEQHLKKYPDSPKRDELERTLVKAAIEANDKQRILTWGEKSLEKNPDQPQVLERVARVLLDSDDKEQSQRALNYARKYEESVRALMKDAPAN